MGQKHNFRFIALLAALLTSACSDLPVQSATHVNWADGDSGTIGDIEFRLADVDAPETGPVGSPRGAKCDEEQRAGQAARDFMRAQTRSSNITYTVLDKDRYDRSVIRLFIDGVSLETLAVDAGHLRPWPHLNGKPVQSKPDWCGS